MSTKNKRSAYSFIEAIIAVAVLSIVIATSATIILTASDTENTNRDLLIGTALAQEGLEAIKNIYYTNILKFGIENATECAFVMPLTDSGDGGGECESSQISNGNYVLTRYLTGSNILQWDISSASGDMIIDDNLTEDFRLYINEIDLGDESVKIYNDDIAGENSKFYREIIIQNIESGTADITSRVAWLRENGNVRNIDVTGSLTLTF